MASRHSTQWDHSQNIITASCCWSFHARLCRGREKEIRGLSLIYDCVSHLDIFNLFVFIEMDNTFGPTNAFHTKGEFVFCLPWMGANVFSSEWRQNSLPSVESRQWWHYLSRVHFVSRFPPTVDWTFPDFLPWSTISNSAAVLYYQWLY